MPDQDDLALPLDIPWQLLSRRGPESPEDPTSLATFVYVPQLPEVDEAYPLDRLIYFKFTASLFPFRLDLRTEESFQVLDEAFAPVWRLILDVQIRPRQAPATPGLKPYFLSAAPTRRAVIETGVVGDHLTEGESDEVAIGRSGSHLIEGFHSTTKTRKFGIGAAAGGLIKGVVPIGGGISYSGSTTSISGGREVSEQVDTTMREASSERKELLSHMTNVNNVLTLLNGSLVGSQSLHFSLWPQPLRPLSVDPNDENLWYAELLKRRSSGIEGMQDFFAIAVVPRGEGFCITENLRRVSVLESPLPEPPVQPSVLFDNFHFNLNDFVKVFSYLSGKYPEGTPLEELDVSLEDRLVPDPAAVPPFPGSITRPALQAWYDAVGAVWVPNPLPQLPPDTGVANALLLQNWADQAKDVLANLAASVKIDTVPRPVVSGWTFSNSQAPSMFRLHALTQPPSLPVPYKWVQDVWLEATQYEYESELAKSPLERGIVLLDDQRLDICASVDQEGVISDVVTTIPPDPDIAILSPIGLPSEVVFPRLRSERSTEPRSKGRGMVSAWALSEAHLQTVTARSSEIAAAPLTFRDPGLIDVFLRRAARLTAADRRNQPLPDVAPRFGFTAAQVKALTATGVTNLSSLASSILAAREMEKLAPAKQALAPLLPQEFATNTLAPELMEALVQSIGGALDASYRRRDRRPAPPRHSHREGMDRRS
jgi:hypothetical protein